MKEAGYLHICARGWHAPTNGCFGLYSTLLYVYSTLLYSTLVYSTLLSTLNINGLDDSVLGDKLDNLDFLNHVNIFDFIVLTETWTRRKVVVPDYNCYNSIDTQRSNSSKD